MESNKPKNATFGAVLSPKTLANANWYASASSPFVTEEKGEKIPFDETNLRSIERVEEKQRRIMLKATMSY
jgi:hypothetical protein